MLWLRWDRSSSRDTLSYKRLGPGPSLGDGARLTMAWDESLGMERQSSDEMVAQDRGTAAAALMSLPPTALWQSHANVPRNRGTKGSNTDLCPHPLSQAKLGARAKVPPTCNATRGLALMR